MVKEMKGKIENSTDLDVTEIVERWRLYARNRMAAAELARTRDNVPAKFEVAVHRARAAVRTEAADVLARSGSIAEAIQTMLNRVRELWQYHPCRWGGTAEQRQLFDACMIRYVRARTWQACAQELDPTVEEIQATWDG